MSYVDPTDRRIRLKKGIAKRIFRLNHEHDEGNEDVLNEVLEQIEVCEELACPLSIETIMRWLKMDVYQIQRAAHKIKFSAS